MAFFRILFVAALASVMLSGCASKMEGERLSVDQLLPADKAQGGEKIDLTGHSAIQAEPLAPQGTQNFQTTAQNMSNSNVQVFPLDGSAPRQNPQARPNLNTPNVQVFPLDQAMAHDMNLDHKPMPLSSRDDGGPLTPMPSGNAGHAVSKEDFAKNGAATVYFDYGSSKLNSAGAETVEAVAWNAASAGSTPLSVNGYASTKAVITDPIRRKMINLKLSMDRAYAVARALIDRGVSPDLIHTAGWGETNEKGSEAESRRVEIRR